MSQSAKLRALTLSLLLVGSVFGGAIGLSDSAGAVADDAELGATDVDIAAGTQTQNVTFTATNGTSGDFNDSATGVVNVSVDPVNNLVFNSVDSLNATRDGTNVAGSGVSAEINGSDSMVVSFNQTKLDTYTGNITVDVGISVDASNADVAESTYTLASDAGTNQPVTFQVTNSDNPSFPDAGAITPGTIELDNASTNQTVESVDVDLESVGQTGVEVVFDVSTLTDNGASISGLGLDVAASDVTNGTVNTPAVDTTAEEVSITIDATNENSFTIDQFTLTGIDTTGADPAQGLSYSVTVGSDTGTTGTFTLGSQSDVYDYDDEVADRDTQYRGQTLLANLSSFTPSVSAGDEVELRQYDSVDDHVGVLENTMTVEEFDGDQVVTFETETLDTDMYVITKASRGSSANANDVRFEVVEQDLLAEFESNETNNAGISKVNLTVESDNRNKYDLTIFVDGFAEEDYTQVFTSSGATLEADSTRIYENDDGDYEIELVNAEGEHELDFEDIDGGEYEFDISVSDSVANDTANITVNDVDRTALDLTQDTVETAQGDVAEITVEMVNTDTGTLLIGDQSEDGYQANVSLEDDGDGEVTVYFNTWSAGLTSADSIGPDWIIWEDTSAEDDVATLDNLDDNAQNITGIMDTGSYELAVKNSDDPQSTADTPDTVGSLYLQERSTDAVSTWTISNGNANDVESLGSLKTAINNDALTESETLAKGDQLVAQMSASGLQGRVVFGEDDLDEDDVVTNFAAFLTNESAPKQTFALTLEQQNPGANTNANKVNFSDEYVSSNLTAYYDAANDDYYVVVDTEVIADSLTEGDDEIADGDEYELTLNVKGQRLLDYTDDEWDDDGTDLYDSASTEFTFEDPTVSFDTAEVDGDDYVTVEAATEQTISGSTNVAPGTELTIRATGEDEARFVKTDSEVVVQPDGTFSGAFDFSDRAVDEEFTARASQGALNALDRSDQEADGLIVEEVEETTTTEEVTTTEEETTTVEEETTTEEEETTTGETTTTEPTETETPGFGIAVAMLALIGAALVALRRKD